MQLNEKNKILSVRIVMPIFFGIMYQELKHQTHFSMRLLRAIISDIKITLLLIVLVTFTSCNPSKTVEKELSEKEKQSIDSVSKVQQKYVVDSLKKINPLLMMPPDSSFTGDYIDKYPNGIIKFKGYYRFGKRHGQWISFYENGLPWSEMHFDKGVRSGVNITYFETGKERYKGVYKNDKRDSIWMYFDSIGNLAEKLLYKDDKVIQKLPIK